MATRLNGFTYTILVDARTHTVSMNFGFSLRSHSECLFSCLDVLLDIPQHIMQTVRALASESGQGRNRVEQMTGRGEHTLSARVVTCVFEPGDSTLVSRHGLDAGWFADLWAYAPSRCCSLLLVRSRYPIHD